MNFAINFLTLLSVTSVQAPIAGLALSGVFLMSGVKQDRTAGNFVKLEHIQSQHGLSDPSISGNKITLKNKTTTMVFEINSRKLLVNNSLIWLNAPLVKHRNSWHIARCDAKHIVSPLFRPDISLSSYHRSTIVLDPGHGGTDRGAIGERNVFEKKVVLDIAKRVITKLKDTGVDIELTREGDQTLTLKERTNKAWDCNADIFISIHINSAQNRKASGIETYVLPEPGHPSTSGTRRDSRSYQGNKHDSASAVLSYHLHKSLVSSVNAVDRGVKRARFEVLKSAPCPAVLIECGFVSNAEEESKMIEASHRDALAKGIARGIQSYINHISDNR